MSENQFLKNTSIKLYFQNYILSRYFLKLVSVYVDLKGTYKLVVAMTSFGAPKLVQFNNKNRLHFSIGGVLKNFFFETMTFFFIWIFFFSVCLFPRILKSQKWASKNENLGENHKFCQNPEKSTNVGFCGKSCDSSVV